ncbi:MAG: hypothetical protein WC595_02580 [Candidatus Nanoarchaeia archaeon]
MVQQPASKPALHISFLKPLLEKVASKQIPVDKAIQALTPYVTLVDDRDLTDLHAQTPPLKEVYTILAGTLIFNTKTMEIYPVKDTALTDLPSFLFEKKGDPTPNYRATPAKVQWNNRSTSIDLIIKALQSKNAPIQQLLHVIKKGIIR